MASPRRGEVWLVDLGMAAKVRPALVISVPAADTDRALVPHTTSPRQSRFEASASVPFLRPGVFDAQNLITIPHAKLIRSLVFSAVLNWRRWSEPSACGSEFRRRLQRPNSVCSRRRLVRSACPGVVLAPVGGDAGAAPKLGVDR